MLRVRNIAVCFLSTGFLFALTGCGQPLSPDGNGSGGGVGSIALPEIVGRFVVIRIPLFACASQIRGCTDGFHQIRVQTRMLPGVSGCFG